MAGASGWRWYASCAPIDVQHSYIFETADGVELLADGLVQIDEILFVFPSQYEITRVKAVGKCILGPAVLLGTMGLPQSLVVLVTDSRGTCPARYPRLQGPALRRNRSAKTNPIFSQIRAILVLIQLCQRTDAPFANLVREWSRERRRPKAARRPEGV
jgi:hypothetical protein